jgi:hypothetical protein
VVQLTQRLDLIEEGVGVLKLGLGDELHSPVFLSLFMPAVTNFAKASISESFSNLIAVLDTASSVLSDEFSGLNHVVVSNIYIIGEYKRVPYLILI